MTTATFESDFDKWRGLGLALLVHAALIAALFIGVIWHATPPSAPAGGGEIEATLVVDPASAASAQKAIRAAALAQRDAVPPPQPIPEKAPQTATIAPQMKPQEALDQPDQVDQQKVSALAQAQADQQQKEQDEKHRQAQILLQQQTQQDAENKQRLAAQELERQKQLDAIHAEQAKVDRQLKLAEQKQQQLEDARKAMATTANPPAQAARPAATPGNNGNSDAGLLGKYMKAINDTANSGWTHVGVPANTRCKVSFTQIPGGQVIDIDYGLCSFDPAARETVERAMHKQPMPYHGFETVFQRKITIEFCYPEDACAK